jgi:hypothetical protein
LLGGDDVGEELADVAPREDGGRVAVIEERLDRLEHAVDERRAQLAPTNMAID